MSTTARTYAQGLVQAALGGWLEQLTAVQRNLRRSSDLAALLNDPNALPTDRESAIGRLIPANTTTEVRRFVELLVRSGDLRLLDDVIRQVRTIVPSLDESSDVVVTSAHELSAQDRERLETNLRAQHGPEIRIRYEVDPELLGGLRIRAGDQITDHSVAARLEALRERLVG
ncbi:MAG: ATP synthase F1 subunit delta [Ardenticatenales bacterium]|nr:ATP synthase F1 subunit delta [Ardenticatenales bacterium]